jgi:hypothetical protein
MPTVDLELRNGSLFSVFAPISDVFRWHWKAIMEPFFAPAMDLTTTQRDEFDLGQRR